MANASLNTDYSQSHGVKGMYFRCDKNYSYVPGYPFCVANHFMIRVINDKNITMNFSLTGEQLHLMYTMNGEEKEDGYIIYFDMPIFRIKPVNSVYPLKMVEMIPKNKEELKKHFHSFINQILERVLPTHPVEICNMIHIALGFKTPKIDVTFINIYHESPIMSNYIYKNQMYSVIPDGKTVSLPYHDPGVQYTTVWKTVWAFVDPKKPYTFLHPKRLNKDKKPIFSASFVSPKSIDYLSNHGKIGMSKIGRIRTHMMVDEKDKLPKDVQVVMIQYRLIKFNIKPDNIMFVENDGDMYLQNSNSEDELAQEEAYVEDPI